MPVTRPEGGRWRYRGPGVLKGDRLGAASPHLPSLDAGSALALARAAAERIRAGGVAIEPWAGGGPARGGVADRAPSEEGVVLFVVRGKARIRFGPHAEFLSEAEAGDAVFMPSGTDYRLLNAAPGRPLDCIRIGQDGAPTPLRIEEDETAPDEEILWIDPVRSS